jgi:hypothetical protein
MAKKSNSKDQKPDKKDSGDVAAKLAAHKTDDQLNPHNQKAKPKGKK